MFVKILKYQNLVMEGVNPMHIIRKYVPYVINALAVVTLGFTIVIIWK